MHQERMVSETFILERRKIPQGDNPSLSAVKLPVRGAKALSAKKIKETFHWEVLTGNSE